MGGQEIGRRVMGGVPGVGGEKIDIEPRSKSESKIKGTMVK